LKWVPRSMPAYFSKTDCLSLAARRHLTRCAVSFVAPPLARHRTERTGVYQTGPTATQGSTAQKTWMGPSSFQAGTGGLGWSPSVTFPRVSRRFLAWSLANPNMPQVMSSMPSPGTTGTPSRYELATSRPLFPCTVRIVPTSHGPADPVSIG
jgi:hypothetical protein